MKNKILPLLLLICSFGIMNFDKSQMTMEDYQLAIKLYANDPIRYLHEVHGYERLDPWQKKLVLGAQTNGKGPKSIAIKAAHGVGKTLVVSGLCAHRLLFYPEAQIKATSATESQLKQAFMGTLKKEIKESLFENWFDVTAESIRPRGLDNNWLQMQAWSKNNPESFAGLHPKSPTLIADEASAIPKEIFESWDGSMQHPNSLEILIGNPVRTSGKLFDAFGKEKDSYLNITVSAYDSSFVSQAWIDKMAAKYGEDSDMFRVRVLGLFPKNDMTVFMSDGKLRNCINREVVVENWMPRIGGLDVGRNRDASVLAIRQGPKLFPLINWKTRNTMIVAEEVAKIIISEKLDVLFVDQNGVGAGLFDRLKVIFNDDKNTLQKIMPVNFGKYALTVEKEYSNKRTKVWGEFDKWTNYGSIDNDDALISEATGLLRYYDQHGRICLETKEEALQRGIASPDRPDAVAYTFSEYIPPKKESSVKSGKRRVSFKGTGIC